MQGSTSIGKTFPNMVRNELWNDMPAEGWTIGTTTGTTSATAQLIRTV